MGVNLDYQSHDDARKETGVLRKLFGPSKEEVWARLADQIGARLEKGSWRTGSRLVADVPPWQIVLDTYTESNGETSATYTRMRAPYANRDGLRFNVYRTSIFTGLGKILGMQDIEIGDPWFDSAFVIQGNNEHQIRALLAHQRLRDLLHAQPHIRFGVNAGNGWFRRKYPPGVDELHFTCPGIVKDVERLRQLYDLFAEVLHLLCHIGSAYESDPGIRI